MDPFGRRLTFNLTVPVANLAGRYNVKGNILGATITSRGTFASEIRELTSYYVITFVKLLMVLVKGEVVLRTGGSREGILGAW